jgi:hypothetical protein
MTNLPEHILKRQADQDAADNLAKGAVAAVLPGPLRAAFAQQQDIEVGDFRVRPFYDADFETLEQLGNPLVQMIALSFNGQESEQESAAIIRKCSRGQHAWDICHILTTDPEAVDATLRAGGITALRAEAKKRFGMRMPTGMLLQIVNAGMTQMNRSWDTMIGYGAAETPDNGEAASSNSPP